MRKVYEPLQGNTRYGSVQSRTAFGTYEAQTQLLPDGTVQYTRRLQMPTGRFEPKDYEAYEDFRQKAVS